jgi:hypothetical protein
VTSEESSECETRNAKCGIGKAERLVTVDWASSRVKNDLMGATVEKILQDVRTLSAEEREQLWRRIAEVEQASLDSWEKEIEHDSSAGKLDHLLANLDEDIAAGRVKPLDEVLDEP